MKPEEKYAKSMKDKDYCKSCVWIPKTCIKLLQAMAEAMRTTWGKK